MSCPLLRIFKVGGDPNIFFNSFIALVASVDHGKAFLMTVWLIVIIFDNIHIFTLKWIYQISHNTIAIVSLREIWKRYDNG